MNRVTIAAIISLVAFILSAIGYVSLDYYDQLRVKQEFDNIPCEEFLSMDHDRNAKYSDLFDQKITDCIRERDIQIVKDRCEPTHIWNNNNNTCTLTTVYPNCSGFGMLYCKYTN